MSNELLPEFLVEHAAERFRVMGDATRLSILHALRRHQSEMNVRQICEALGGASQANISKHLLTLHRAGIVSRRAEGTAAYYSIADPSITQLCEIVCDRLRQQAVEDARSFAIV